MSEPLYHLVQKSLWSSAQQEGQPYFPPTYAQDGFTHLSSEPAFLLGIGTWVWEL